MKTPPIIIAGGGIAGLAAALACRNHHTLVLEQASAFSPIGAGLQLGPNAVRALQKLDAWDRVESITSSPPAIHIRDGLSGKILKAIPLGQHFEKRYGAPYRVAHRADLHEALLACVSQQPNLEVRLSETITSLSNHSDSVAVQTSHTNHTAQNVIAADGVGSAIRQMLFSRAPVVDSGLEFHRSLLPMPSSITNMALECVNVWMYPGGHVVHYPVGRDERLNIIAITPAGERPISHFAKAAEPLQNLLQHAQTSWTIWPGLYAPPLNTWKKNRVLLLGDAAHGTLPFLAQGAAMALEDAACLAEVLRSAKSLDDAFAETAAHRPSRTTKLHKASQRAGRLYHAEGPLRHLRNTGLTYAPPSFLTAGLDWIYRGE
jgi:salicylate hydroxylase